MFDNYVKGEPFTSILELLVWMGEDHKTYVNNTLLHDFTLLQTSLGALIVAIDNRELSPAIPYYLG